MSKRKRIQNIEDTVSRGKRIQNIEDRGYRWGCVCSMQPPSVEYLCTDGRKATVL